MNTNRMNLFGRAVNPALVGIPMAFYAVALVSLITYQLNADPFWYRVGYLSSITGIACAFVAAIPSFLQWYRVYSLDRGYSASQSPVDRDIRAQGTLQGIALVLFLTNIVVLKNRMDLLPVSVGFPIFLATAALTCSAVAAYFSWIPTVTATATIDTIATARSIHTPKYPDYMDVEDSSEDDFRKIG